MLLSNHQSATSSLKGFAALAIITFFLGGLGGCHGHLKHVDGPGHSEDAPGQQKKH